jgi:hypothetical protein
MALAYQSERLQLYRATGMMIAGYIERAFERNPLTLE